MRASRTRAGWRWGVLALGLLGLGAGVAWAGPGKEVWQRVLDQLERYAKPLGLDPGVLAVLPAEPLEPGPLTRVRGDVLALERTADALVMDVAGERAGADVGLAGLVARGFSALGVSAGAGVEVPMGADWGVPWIPRGVDAEEAARFALALRLPDGQRGFILAGPDQRAWEALPEGVQRLVIRVFVGAVLARPWVQGAFDEEWVVDAVGANGVDEVGDRALSALASSAWVGTDDLRPGAAMRVSVDAIERTRLEPLAYGSAIFLRHLDAAIEELRASGVLTQLPGMSLATCRLKTALGDIVVLGSGDDVFDEPAFLVIDLGGNDRYRAPVGAPRSLRFPIAASIDLLGNDTYAPASRAPASAVYGLGVVVDLDGNDTYVASGHGPATVWHGVAVLADFAGDDAYLTDQSFGQGCAHVGVAILEDRAGDDTYTLRDRGQGFGGTKGVGMLIDRAGADVYTAAPTGERPALAQGVGAGVDASATWGLSLPGGIGLLVDVSGNDRYTSGPWSQGAAIQRGLGVLADLAGDDAYESGPGSWAAAEGLSAARFLERRGADTYNLERGPQPHTAAWAHGASLALFSDEAGDDRYELGSGSGASSAAGGIAVFIESAGADRYSVAATEGDALSLGAAAPRVPTRTWLDDLPAYAAFLDLGGDDHYPPGGTAANASQWRTDFGPTSWSVGIDTAPTPPPVP